jgi:hypothetical protein
VIQTVAALDQILSLNCFVLGDDPDRMFTVEIAKTKNVSILKDLIKVKKAPHLDRVAASDLDLWKVDFSPDNLEAELANFKPDSHPKLSSVQRLSMLKDGIVDDHLHVIAKVPGMSRQIFFSDLEAIQTVAALDQILSLNCFVLGDDPDRMFTVEIAKTKNISILKDLIKEKKDSQLKDVDASDLNLWRVEFPIDLDDLPSNPSAYGFKLRSGKLLSDVFPSGLGIHCVHVVAHVPSPVISECYMDLWYDFAHYSVVQSIRLSKEKRWREEISGRSMLLTKVRVRCAARRDPKSRVRISDHAIT